MTITCAITQRKPPQYIQYIHTWKVFNTFCVFKSQSDNKKSSRSVWNGPRWIVDQVWISAREQWISTIFLWSSQYLLYVQNKVYEVWWGIWFVREPNSQNKQTNKQYYVMFITEFPVSEPGFLPTHKPYKVGKLFADKALLDLNHDRTDHNTKPMKH